MHNNPIGIFDSGVGGITILNSIKEIMPNEDIIYFSDNQILLMDKNLKRKLKT